MERAEQVKDVWHKAFENLVDEMNGLTREQLASGFFELGWRAADENPPKGTSLVKWQTGEPKEKGTYLITYQLDENTNVTTFLFNLGCTWVNGDCKEIDESKVIAWCKLSDIEPYKE